MDTATFTTVQVEAWQLRDGDRIRPFGYHGEPWQTVQTVSARFSGNPVLDDWVVLSTDLAEHSASPGVIFTLRVPADWTDGWDYRQASGCRCVERRTGEDVETVALFSCPAHGDAVPGYGGWNQRDDDSVVAEIVDED